MTFIPSSEQGIHLQLVEARPQKSGPLPVLIFNHGSTGQGKNAKFFARTISPEVIRSYFTERGWLVLFPQRRGRGKSAGQYAEGLATDGSGYSCDTEIAFRGFERAVEDLDAVMAHIKTRNYVDFKTNRKYAIVFIQRVCSRSLKARDSEGNRFFDGST